jgi:hypothetical protein
MKLQEYLIDTINRRLSLGSITDSSANIYSQDTRRLPKNLLDQEVTALRRRDIENAVIDMRQRKLSPTTIRHTLGFLASVLNDAVDNEIIQGNPALRIKTPKQTGPKLNRNVSDEDLKAALAVARKHTYGFLFRFALGSGLRRGELLALNWSDLDFQKGTVTVRRNIVRVGKAEVISQPKTQSSCRTVTLPASIVQEALTRKGDKGPDQPVFENSSGGRMGLACASIGIKDLLRSVGLDDQTMHSLRHTHASQLVSSGLPLPAITARMGHTDVRTTMGIYAHASKSEDAKLADAISGTF